MKRVVLFSMVILCSFGLFSGVSGTYIGIETNPFSTGALLRISDGSITLETSVQYPLVPTLVVVAMENVWLSPMVVWTVSAQSRVFSNDHFGISVGPCSWLLSKGIERIVVATYGLDMDVEFNQSEESGHWAIGLMLPVMVQGEMVNSSPTGVAWAWDEFGFALIPTVKMFWEF